MPLKGSRRCDSVSVEQVKGNRSQLTPGIWAYPGLKQLEFYRAGQTLGLTNPSRPPVPGLVLCARFLRRSLLFLPFSPAGRSSCAATRASPGGSRDGVERVPLSARRSPSIPNGIARSRKLEANSPFARDELTGFCAARRDRGADRAHTRRLPRHPAAAPIDRRPGSIDSASATGRLPARRRNRPRIRALQAGAARARLECRWICPANSIPAPASLAASEPARLLLGVNVQPSTKVFGDGFFR